MFSEECVDYLSRTGTLTNYALATLRSPEASFRSLDNLCTHDPTDAARTHVVHVSCDASVCRDVLVSTQRFKVPKHASGVFNPESKESFRLDPLVHHTLRFHANKATYSKQPVAKLLAELYLLLPLRFDLLLLWLAADIQVNSGCNVWQAGYRVPDLLALSLKRGHLRNILVYTALMRSQTPAFGHALCHMLGISFRVNNLGHICPLNTFPVLPDPPMLRDENWSVKRAAIDRVHQVSLAYFLLLDYLLDTNQTGTFLQMTMANRALCTLGMIALGTPHCEECGTTAVWSGCLSRFFLTGEGHFWFISAQPQHVVVWHQCRNSPLLTGPRQLIRLKARATVAWFGGRARNVSSHLAHQLDDRYVWRSVQSLVQ